MCRFAVHFAHAAQGLFLHDGDAGTIDLNIHDGDGRTERNGQPQLDAALDLSLLVASNAGADRARRDAPPIWWPPADLPAVPVSCSRPSSKGESLARHGHHTPHSGRELPVLDAEGVVAGIGGVMRVGTDVAGAQELDRTCHGEDGFGAEILSNTRFDHRSRRDLGAGAGLAGAGGIRLRRRHGACFRAPTSRPLPDRDDRFCGSRQRSFPAGGLLRAQLLAGPRRPFFFL